MKKHKIEEYTDGRASSLDLESIESILGNSANNPFEVITDADLQDKMQSLSLIDLQAFAVRAGVFPSGNKVAIKNRLEKAFSSYRKGASQIQLTQHMVSPDSRAGKQALKILEGNG
jgi:hypothetical protein